MGDGWEGLNGRVGVGIWPGEGDREGDEFRLLLTFLFSVGSSRLSH